MAGSEAAMFRIALRQFAPRLKKMFSDIAYTWNENVSMVYMTLRYKPGSDITNHKNVLVDFHSIMSNNTVSMRDNPNMKTTEEEKEMLDEAFPIGAEMLHDQSILWETSPYDLFMLIRIKNGSGDMDDPDTTEIQIRTREGIKPAKSKIIE